ncbi:ribonuclease J [Spiroplasma sp. TIUS-1]|uniref:ribonuclease J n=1 Tax=Spiroplasma sp. TIUS-1 TaxID=216963 RepID=UPI001399027A|nr:ribonuclease J [Spiroplasma sp. TIUS-1]QHX35760.1 ribonuclease J [Spiroplasma sp. TIUS-1]
METNNKLKFTKAPAVESLIKKINIRNNDKPTLVFALGGLEEIGKNTYVIEYDDEIMIIDAGVKFASENEPGISAIVPDYTYLLENEHKITGLFITHGHEDHIGGIPYLLQKVKVPAIYAPELAAELIKEKLKDFKLQNSTLVKEYVEDDVYKSKHMTVRFAAVNHSIPDAFGIHIQTPNGAIFSTGDYKFDWTPLGHTANIQRMSEFGEQGLELLMADSTNAEVEGYTIGEKSVMKNIDSHILQAKGRIVISSFASNVHRFQEMILLAKKYSKRVVIVGWSLERMIKVIKNLGHLDIDEKMFIKQTEVDKFPKNQVMIICTGSQGEPMAALSKMAKQEHKYMKIIPGDTVIFSSSPIPGNKMDVELIVNRLTKLGARVIVNSSSNLIHTSGHASQEEQKLLFSIFKPHYFMPMHGEFRMLKTHAETAAKVNVPRDNSFVIANGDTIVMQNGKATLGKRIPAEAVYIDGKDQTGKASAVIKERTTLSKEGLIIVIISIDSKTNKMIYPPKIISRGCFYVKDSFNVINESIRIVGNSVNDLLKTNKVTFHSIKQSVRESISPYIFRAKRRNPLIIPVILNKTTPENKVVTKGVAKEQTQNEN